ncbi:probable cysteine--tRNA ligase, mitochondrial [Cimex lectularius]|uniref:cysteine--tRNA ligase n=1 Tax=Cimex lectularius TaxID=79782 RepID=A0A8I6RTT9_CIMLE|nr:probable cysteine--tRNA ligase, mitochondrial [Cimex lectularius]
MVNIIRRGSQIIIGEVPVCKMIGRGWPARRIFRILLRNYSKSWRKPDGFETGLKVHNSLTRCKVDLVTKRDRILSWYSCGPTVYDSAHIGHACCYMQYDLMRRILEDYFGINVIFVMGVTDIDDKIIAKANRLGVEFRDVSKKYEQEFFNDLASLNIKMPTFKARVTDYIEDIVKFISVIVDSGLGYVMPDGTVNFNTGKFPAYGKLVSTCEEEESGGKLSNRDFAMWKGAKPDEPSWPSPWGPGRPGWHIECSTIASKLLGTTIDFHTGGIDLKFPHHENEEAQCCAHHKIDQWVNYWLHTGHLHQSDDAKMSKSLNNTISIQDFLSEYSANHLRMLCMMVPYRNPIEYSKEVIENAVAVEKKFTNFLSDCNSYFKRNELVSINESSLLKELENTRNSVLKCLSNDFDTSSALLHVTKLLSETNSQLQNRTTVSESPSYSILAISNYVSSFLNKFGFSYNQESVLSYRLDSVIESVVNFRTTVRQVALSINKQNSKEILENKNSLLNACDSLRNELNDSGFELKDYGKLTTWNKST